MVSETFAPPLKVRDTADCETPAIRATSIEEAYFFLDGECEAELDGTVHTVRAGDVVFAGVGAVHGFYNNGTGRVRWIETQAPQPPARHAYRRVPVWKRFEEE